MFRPLYKAIFRWVFLKLVLVTLSLADKCNKDQLKYPPEDGLIKRPKHVVMNKQRN
jgi:hypothetical protein